MKITTKCRSLLFLVLLVVTGQIMACTSVLVSGKATKDGRPLLFKNRDTGDLNNLSVLVQGEKYKYLAIVAARDLKPTSVWGGHNEAGFAIINTAAYNLNKGDDKSGGRDGQVMRRALEICATLKDFETMLDTLSHPLGLDSNYGVIDADGGCAYYETGNKGYVKFDANDPKIAPHGYLVRTNHGFTGERSLDKGVERFMAITSFMQKTDVTGMISYDYLITQIPRYLTHGLTKMNLYDFMPADDSQAVFFPFRDFIPRYQSSSTILVQGVKKGESPSLTVSWTIVGSPLTTLAIPLCITPSGKLPSIVTRGADGSSQLCQIGLKLKEQLFPVKVSNGADYINLAKLINKKGTGIMQLIRPIEQNVMSKGAELLEKERQSGKFGKEMDDYYRWVDDYVLQFYKSTFSL